MANPRDEVRQEEVMHVSNMRQRGEMREASTGIQYCPCDQRFELGKTFPLNPIKQLGHLQLSKAAHFLQYRPSIPPPHGFLKSRIE